MNTLIAVHFPILGEGIEKVLADVPDVSVKESIQQIDQLFSLSYDFESGWILILDLNLLAEDEKKSVKKLLEKFSELEILAMGDDENKHDVRGIMQAGASGYISKTQSIDELIRAIRKVIEGDIYLSDRTLGMLYTRSGSELKNKFSSADLTQRESQVLSLICQELTNREIADKLSISVRTVDAHRRNVLQKTGARNTAGLVKYAIKHQIYTLS